MKASIRRLVSVPKSIHDLARAGLIKPAIGSLILHRSLGDPVPPDSFVAILKSVSSPKSLMCGKQLHAHMVVTDFNRDTLVQNYLIVMYGKCGSLDDAHSIFRLMSRKNLHSWNTLIDCYCKFGSLSKAQQLFDEMPQRDAVSWNTMISGYDQHGPCEVALKFFVGMRQSECNVDHFGVSSAISACCNLRFMKNGKEIHGLSHKVGLDLHLQVGSALVELYGKCQLIDDAVRVFEGMVFREQFTWNSMLAGYIECSNINEALHFFGVMQRKDVVSWTMVISGCSRHHMNEEAVELFHMMQEAGLWPDWLCFVSALNACVQMLDLEEGLNIHGQILKFGFQADAIIGSVLVALYARCGWFDSAKRVANALDYIDEFSLSVLISEYAKHGRIDCAYELFESSEAKTLPLWNALIGGYADLGLDEEALAAFRQMKMDGINGDGFTFGSLLLVFKNLGRRYGEQIHSQTIKMGVEFSVFVSSALIDMYSSSLVCEAAINIFNAIHKPNLVSWNAMISGYALNNMNSEAILTFQLMAVSRIKPDNITFSLILDSCSSLLSLPGGMQVHAMAYKLGFESDVVVGSALVDLYGKCGNMHAASQAFSDIHGPSVVSWTALLSGFVRHGMWDAAKEVFNRMPQKNVVSWNTLISGHAKHGSGLEAFELYSQMAELGQFPDHISFISLLMVCGDSLLEEPGKQVHGQILKTGYYRIPYVSTALNKMYQKLGNSPDKSNLCSSFCFR
ncbi:Tetratricopeptide-like helical domain-containing protein [Dioscorea alata]|uniref:Tetratricopeptide-like helical domain-containing protein n=1 Tax=Dioscorea alata TaxID=55571 RepID=A0ACB7W454_DIOAL|nr:Tetratricopeptide-like helical domain-containing protein [Dioscorea alata]